MPQVPGVMDAARVLQAYVEAITQLPGTLMALNRTMRGLTLAVEDSREVLASVQRIAARLETVLDEVEEPVRALVPGVRRMAAVLEDPVVEEIPDTVRRIRAEILPVLTHLQETQRDVAAIAGSTARITGLVDEAGSRLGALSMGGLLRRPRRGDPADPPDEPPAATTP
jgi:ABC-type transporter Mla subunit MlaD